MFWDKVNNYSKPLRLSILEGMFASLMFGGGMIFIVPFAVYLGANSFEIGLIAALPALLAAWFQLGTLEFLKVFKNRKNTIIPAVFLQSISWLLIALIPFIFPTDQIFWLIVITTIGTLAGSIGTPLWQSWMRSLTATELIGEYFGIRNAITGAIVFLTMLGCGLLLKLFEPSLTLYAFVAIFLISFIGRLASSITFTKMEDPCCEIDGTEKIWLFDFIKELRTNNFGYFVLFGTLMTFAISLVGPFFSLYLLDNLALKFDYFTYTIIICSSAVASLISMPYWGKIIDKYGTIKTLKATGLLASIYPLALILIHDPLGLTIAEFLSGIIFSGFNLCLASFIYESFKAEKIIKYASYQAALFGTATFFGIMLSGYVQTFNVSFPILTNTFYIICLVAVVLRLTIYSALVNKIKDVRETKPIQEDQLVIGVLTFEPVRETLYTSASLLLATTEREFNTTIRTMEIIKDKGGKELKEGAIIVGRIGVNGTRRIVKTAKQAEEFAVGEIERVEDITLTGLEKAEEITVKGLKKAKNRIIREKEKRRAKGFI
ncbi:MAG: MFS transporter [archaeon]|jgi:hypothetical protein